MTDAKQTGPRNKTPGLKEWLIIVFIIVLGIYVYFYEFNKIGFLSRPIEESKIRSSAVSEITTETVVKIFESDSNLVTRPFSVPNNWEIQWTYHNNRHFSITLYKANGDYVDLITNSSGKTSSGKAFQPVGGSYYLKINGNGQWKISVVKLD